MQEVTQEKCTTIHTVHRAMLVQAPQGTVLQMEVVVKNVRTPTLKQTARL